MEGDDIDFSGIDEDLEQFQQDDIVRQALRDGVDLRGYARDIQMELREVRLHSPRVAAARKSITQLVCFLTQYTTQAVPASETQAVYFVVVASAPGFVERALSSRLSLTGEC